MELVCHHLNVGFDHDNDQRQISRAANLEKLIERTTPAADLQKHCSARPRNSSGTWSQDLVNFQISLRVSPVKKMLQGMPAADARQHSLAGRGQAALSCGAKLALLWFKELRACLHAQGLLVKSSTPRRGRTSAITPQRRCAQGLLRPRLQKRAHNHQTGRFVRL